MDLTEAEDIKKRWREYTEELYKKDLHDPGNHDGVITHLEPDILECEVKWALESITMNKASEGDGIPVELFQILKDDVFPWLGIHMDRMVHQQAPGILGQEEVILREMTVWEGMVVRGMKTNIVGFL